MAKRGGPGGRLSRTAAPALVRRGAATPILDRLDAGRAARRLHQPLRADRGHDREQLTPRAGHPRDETRPSRSARCDGEELPCSTRARARGDGRDRRPLHRGRWPLPGYWRDAAKTSRFLPDPARPRRADDPPELRLAKISMTGSSTSSGAPTRRSSTEGTHRAGRDRGRTGRARASCSRWRRRSGQRRLRGPRIAAPTRPPRASRPIRCRSEQLRKARRRRTWCPDPLAPSKVLPKNVNGKIDRRGLRELLRARCGHCRRATREGRGALASADGHPGRHRPHPAALRRGAQPPGPRLQVTTCPRGFLDSLALVGFLFAIERQFEVTIGA